MPKNYELDPPPPPNNKTNNLATKKINNGQKIDLKIQGKYG